MSRQILAIDIRNDSIAAVLINVGLKMSSVERTAHLMLPTPSEEEDPLVPALTQLKEAIDPGTANVVVSLPPEGILYRKVSVPFKEDNKIKQVLPFELEPLMPIEINNLKIDFHKNQVAEETDILAVAIEQTVLEKYTDAFSAANMRPQLIVPGCFPLAKYLSQRDELSSLQMLVLDVENDQTTLFAINSGKIELVRKLPSGVHSEQAAEALALKIRQTLTALSDLQNEYIVPATVFLTGPGLQKHGIYQRIALSLEMSAEKADLIKWAPRLEMDNRGSWIPEVMNNAMALALLEADGSPCANFHRTSSPFRNFWTTYRQYIMGPAALLAAVLIIGFSSVIIDIILLNKTVKKLNTQIKQVYVSTFPDSTIENPTLAHMKSKIKELKEGDSSSGLSPTTVRTVDVLLQVSQLIPKDIDVLLTQMSMSIKGVTISGETGDFNSVDDIKSRMEKGDIINQVTIASANMDKSGKKVRFKLKIEL